MSDLTVVPGSAITAATKNEAFTKEDLDRELWQCEILSNVTLYLFDPVTEDVDVTVFEYAIVMSQDCDLEQDHRKRQSSQQSDLTSIILYQADDASTIRTKVSSGDIARRVKENREERFHYLEEVPVSLDAQASGIPALTIDFKKFFCLKPEELYRQLATKDALRRSRLVSPYKEHLQSRAVAYSARVGLPRQHAFK